MVEQPDIYLFPAIVGGGWGDIESVLAAGRRLLSKRFRVAVFRPKRRPLPRAVDGPWRWGRIIRTSELRPRSTRALTVSESWGITAAPGRAEPLGRAGPWADEVEAVEATYGTSSTLHVSLEEFARTLTSREEVFERYREGGWAIRRIRERLRGPSAIRQIREHHELFRKFHGFDRRNLLSLFPTFSPRTTFSREYPEAVQCGPLWPRLFRRGAYRPAGSRRGFWFWYASPSSSSRIAPWLLRALASKRPPVDLVIVSPRPIDPPSRRERGHVQVRLGPISNSEWLRLFRQAQVRIVSGSRSLLEALELGGPFLYFNGVLGKGSSSRRHRPEKIDRLLAALRQLRTPPRVLGDLARFAQGRGVGRVVARNPQLLPGNGPIQPQYLTRRFSRPYNDAGDLLVAVARRLALGFTAESVIAATRAGTLGRHES